MRPKRKSEKGTCWKNLMASNVTDSNMPRVVRIATMDAAISATLMASST